ncbi:MAG: hypothetical protein ACREMB_08675 [Candidatus Rokuibacteriota bacterium]
MRLYSQARLLPHSIRCARMECMRSWEMAEANRAWDEKREARFHPPP